MFCREQFISRTLQPSVWIFNGSNWIIAGTLREWGAYASFRPDRIPSGAPSSIFAIVRRENWAQLSKILKAGDFFPQSYKHQLGTEAALTINHLKISLCVMLPGLRAGATAGHCLVLWWDCGPLLRNLCWDLLVRKELFKLCSLPFLRTITHLVWICNQILD